MRYKELLNEVKPWVPDPEDGSRGYEADGSVETNFALSAANKLRADGWILIGGGVNKDVWQKEGVAGVQLMINSIGVSHELFDSWYNFCKTNSSNPFLPKYSKPEKIEVESKSGKVEPFIKITMEHLNPLANDSVPELVTSFICNDRRDDCAFLHKEFEKPGGFEKFFNGDFDDVTVGHFAVSKLSEEVMISFLSLEEFKELYSIAREIVRVGKQHGWRIDMHSGNFMQRASGQVVITDPWIERVDAVLGR